jgi:hypothetical protein
MHIASDPYINGRFQVAIKDRTALRSLTVYEQDVPWQFCHGG